MAEVQTVLGPVDSSELGITLVHEHLFLDRGSLWEKPPDIPEEFAFKPIEINMLGQLRVNPYINKENVTLDDEQVVIEEVKEYFIRGGRTIIDVTTPGIGRNPIGLRNVSLATGVQIIMGSGYYLHDSHPDLIKSMSVDEIKEQIVKDLTEGVNGTGIRAGIIGEIGISPALTDRELTVLKAAARAQNETNTVLSIHLPAWKRVGHKVLDIIEEEGGNVHKTILGHMNPSISDPDYQESLAKRGCYLAFDMIGMDFYFPGEGQCPSDEENARGIIYLMERGYTTSILMSQDVFLKIMWKRYGGWGYSHILENFVPRLKRHGASNDEIKCLLVDNPREVFER